MTKPSEGTRISVYIFEQLNFYTFLVCLLCIFISDATVLDVIKHIVGLVISFVFSLSACAWRKKWFNGEVPL